MPKKWKTIIIKYGKVFAVCWQSFGIWPWPLVSHSVSQSVSAGRLRLPQLFLTFQFIKLKISALPEASQFYIRQKQSESRIFYFCASPRKGLPLFSDLFFYFLPYFCRVRGDSLKVKYNFAVFFLCSMPKAVHWNWLGGATVRIKWNFQGWHWCWNGKLGNNY